MPDPIDTDDLRRMLEAATPGPWIADADYEFSGVKTKAEGLRPGRTHGYGCENDFICDLNDGEYHEYASAEEQSANARLIALAPQLAAEVLQLRADLSALRAREAEMRAALRGLLSDCDLSADRPEFIAARAALPQPDSGEGA
ncbi:hypothetical protein PARHAE_00710 [Paracoccus haematequi]|uniref:Uncharacterized protein n=1 Tax=Paracoccus haematequi TaxID=2491866 RepID=A0A447IJ72_9RHOB|nr:hypothetical protein [Paracoccus haematequi]VDS07533.1 hypothetical protein PARHAE_00710 [Paracoccus haematequi]